MPTCQKCGHHGWFLRLSPKGFCDSCQVAIDLEESDRQLESFRAMAHDKIRILSRAKSLGIVLTLEFRNDKYVDAVPIEIEEQSAIFIVYDGNQVKRSWKFDTFEILGDGFPLEREDTIKKNLEDIKKRISNAIDSIEYWNDKLESVYDEDLIFISEDDYYIEVRDNYDRKTHKIRKPFIRNITFEGQWKEEIISKLDEPPAKYEGYECFNLASGMIADKKPEDIASSHEADTIIKLLEKTIADNTISSYTHASACRILGEISEAEGDRRAAIEYYEKALSLNGKIGVKNKLKKLKNSPGG